MEKKVLIKIPTSERPMFKVDVNGVDYEYPAGIETEVPESVASVIQNIYDLTPKPLPPQPSGGGTDTRMKELIEGTLTELYDDTITSVGYYGLAYKTMDLVSLPNVTEVGERGFNNAIIKTISLPNVKTIKKHGMYSIKAEEIYMPNVEVIGSGAFYFPALSYSCIEGDLTLTELVALGDQGLANCKLESANFPKLKSCSMSAFSGDLYLKSVSMPQINIIAQETFKDCKALENVYIPNFKKVNSGSFLNCHSLQKLESKYIGIDAKIETTAFTNCYSYKCLVLRNTSKFTLTNVSAFNNCYHFHGTVNSTYNPDGLKDGYIYVPRSLIEEYKVDTNWVTFADQFRAIEDYTVDGTVTGEIDWERMGVAIE